jgi:ADP-ribosylglycohydrolase
MQVLSGRIAQGAAIDEEGFAARIDAAADSYDALYELALELREPAVRADWPYREPIAWDDIVAQSERLDPRRTWSLATLDSVADKVKAAFLGSVCGCMLGKPIEVDPNLAELKAVAGTLADWPLDDYVGGDFLDALGRRHESWEETIRENIRYVAADDDLHYSIIGMLLLEGSGPDFNVEDLYRCWQLNLAPGWTWGGERTALLAQGLNRHHLFEEAGITGGNHDVLLLNPGDESCGALIRADAYGYACPGNPDLAAWLAWKDASFTHIKTGVYGAMFIAALIALCGETDGSLSGNDRLLLVHDALKRVPGNTRFAEVVRDATEKVAGARDWESGYAAVHGQYANFTHCQVYQEIGTLINTLKFADSVGHGIGLQVSQGNDTDSFGATAGSILGMLYGPGYLGERWLAPFNDEIRHALANFHEHSLNELAERMAQLPAKIYSATL